MRPQEQVRCTLKGRHFERVQSGRHCRFRHSTAQWPHLDRLEPRLCLSALFTLAPGSPISVGYIPNLAAVGDFDGKVVTPTWR